METSGPGGITLAVVVIAAALAGVILIIAAALLWTARLVHIGNLDVQALADKVAVPNPTSALDWPELRVHEYVPQPDGLPLVLLDVCQPAFSRQAATLLVALDSGDQRALAVLSRWRSGQASIAPTRQVGEEFEIRRRQSLERVHAVLVAEDRRLSSDG
jgi:hypothetical protein